MENETKINCKKKSQGVECVRKKERKKKVIRKKEYANEVSQRIAEGN
jgi:hypothetical protein